MKPICNKISNTKLHFTTFSHPNCSQFNCCLILLFWTFFLSCDRNTSQTEKDYIKNLEEKNKKLEMELQNFRGTKLDSTVQRKSEIANKYFTIGSTEDEVITVMGEPTSYLKTAPEAYKLLYGVSTVYFYKGKVISYEDLGGNLKARVRRQDSPKK